VRIDVGAVVAERYQVEGVLGQGGMGAIYRARDLKFGDPVALKVAAGAGAAYDEFRARFQREARIGNRLGKLPGFVRAIDWGELPDGVRLYLAMDLVEDAGPLDLAGGPRRARVERLLQAARLVADAHRAGIVHRDLKPANFLQAADGTISLTDFGLAKADWIEAPLDAALTGGVTRSGLGFGTPVYMGPEQFEDAKRADRRADVYALGVMLFQALTGELPFPGGDFRSIWAKQERVRSGTAPAPRPRDLDPSGPEDLDALCARAIALEVDARLPDADALVAGLEAALAGGDLDAGPVDAVTVPVPAPAGAVDSTGGPGSGGSGAVAPSTGLGSGEGAPPAPPPPPPPPASDAVAPEPPPPSDAVAPGPPPPSDAVAPEPPAPPASDGAPADATGKAPGGSDEGAGPPPPGRRRWGLVVGGLAAVLLLPPLGAYLALLVYVGAAEDPAGLLNDLPGPVVALVDREAPVIEVTSAPTGRAWSLEGSGVVAGQVTDAALVDLQVFEDGDGRRVPWRREGRTSSFELPWEVDAAGERRDLLLVATDGGGRVARTYVSVERPASEVVIWPYPDRFDPEATEVYFTAELAPPPPTGYAMRVVGPRGSVERVERTPGGHFEQEYALGPGADTIEVVIEPPGGEPTTSVWRRPRPAPSSRPTGGGEGGGKGGGGGESGGARPAARGPDLSHVRVDQEYHYALNGGGLQVWTVRAVGRSRVEYAMQTLFDMGKGGLTAVGEPTVQTWAWQPPPDDGRELYPDATIGREVVRVSGLDLNCMVVEAGGAKSWVAVDPGWRPGDVDFAPTFPPLVKSVTEGRVTMELVEIVR